MKIPNLRAKFKPKRCKGNLHFGKILLALIMVFVMVLGNVESVEANGKWKVIASRRIGVDWDGYIRNGSFVETKGNQVRAGANISWSGNEKDLERYYTAWRTKRANASYEADAYFEDRYTIIIELKEYVPPNDPPTIPSSITVPNVIKSEENFNVSWGSSTDSDGDSISYRLERQINGGSWTQVYSGSNRSKTETSLTSWNTVRYRVRAYDGNAYSGYKTSPIRTVIHNSEPTLSISSPSQNSYFGKEKPINISGTVKDTDSGDTLTVKYTISGITAHTNKTLRTITANGNNQSFSNDISIDTSIPEGTYILKVWVEDNNGGKSSEVTRKINVDKTPPNVPSLNLDESWTNENRTFTITGGADNTGGSGLDRIEYRIGNGAWTRYSTIVTALSNSGTIQVQARAIDKVGNISSVVSKTARVDKIKPTVTITNNDTNWHSDNITVNVKHSDDGGSGVKTKQYAITNSSTKPSTGWINLASENQNVIVSNNGNNYVHVRIIDNANNETYSYKGPFKVDKIAPILNPPIAKAISGTKIKITANANDNLSGLHSTPYLYNRDGTDITNWISSNILEDENLDPNRQYAYKYKAKDSVGNVSEYSNEVKKYTKALNPEKIILKEVTGTSLTFEVINDSSNINTPETILRLEGVKDTGWHTNEVKSFNNLEPGKTYKLSINTRNGDNEENGWLNAPGNIPIEDEFGNPIYEIVTIVPVEDFKVTGSSVNSLTVSWDKADNQEYQVYLKDESGNEISNSRSNWLDNNMYTFSNLSKPNTKYIPYIITRRGTNQLPEVKIENENKAYTNAEGISRGTFESGEDYITITLSVGDTNNPSDTEYFIKNDITGQPEVKVTHDNPVWKNTNLAKESYYTYSVRVVNKNGEDSYYTRLVFENGDEASTIIPDLEIEPGKIMPDDGEYIDLDELKNHDHGDEVWFNPEVDLNNNIVQLEGDKYKVTRNRIEEIKNREEIEVINYSYSREGFGYTDWKPLEEGFFTEKLVFNMPGIYLTHWKFKNYRIESDPVLINYYVDWIAPTIEGEPAIKGQSVVTGNEFRVVINAKDNISPYLFYSTDDGLTWFLLKEGQNEIVFSNINKSSNGIQNKLTIKIADIAGNVVEKTFTVWGIEK